MAETVYFISYVRSDGEFALKVAKDLRDAGVAVWLDQLDIVPGQHWDRAVEAALARCQGLIVVLTPEALASNNVMDEVSYGLEEKKTVIPLILRRCDLPFRLRRVQHVDFTGPYEPALTLLLRAVGGQRPVVQEVSQEPPLPPAVRRPLFTSPPEASPELLEPVPEPLPLAETASLKPESLRHPAAKSAVVGGLIGAMLGSMFVLPTEAASLWFIAAALVGVPGAIAGFLSGRDRRLVTSSLIGAVAAVFSGVLAAGSYVTDDEWLNALVYGSGVGSVVGAIAGRLLKRLKKWQ